MALVYLWSLNFYNFLKFRPIYRHEKEGVTWSFYLKWTPWNSPMKTAEDLPRNKVEGVQIIFLHSVKCNLAV